MTSQAQAAGPLADVRGLVFLGFPLHPARKPSVARAAHLADVRVPMLFLQGARDALAERTLIEADGQASSAGASLVTIEDADHSFHVPKRSGRSDAEVMAAMLDSTALWIEEIGVA